MLREELIALGVALIPSKKWCLHFEEWNRTLLDCSVTPEHKLAHTLLFDELHLPHLTLYQCFMAYDACIKGIERFKAMIVNTRLPVELQQLGISAGNPLQNGETTPWLDLNRNDPILWALHSAARASFEPSVAPNLSLEEAQRAFAESDVDQDCINFVSNYPAKTKSGAFTPHVTIGFGKFSCLNNVRLADEQQLEFDRLIVGKLGNFCSIGKEVFWEKLS